jgi:AcrR family transcriptional regulator
MARRKGLSTALVDALAVGGQIGTTSRVENYLGFPVGISGEEFAQRAYIQALRFGASIVLPATASGLSGYATAGVIHLDTGDNLTAHSVIITTGVTYRKIATLRLRRVCEKAGLSTGAFYVHWATMEEYYNDLAEHLTEDRQLAYQADFASLTDLARESAGQDAPAAVGHVAKRDLETVVGNPLWDALELVNLTGGRTRFLRYKIDPAVPLSSPEPAFDLYALAVAAVLAVLTRPAGDDASADEAILGLPHT